jgi:hypothetical protein
MVEQEIIDRVCEPILKEFRLAFQGLRDTIAAIPDDEWIRGEAKGDVPVRQACHLLHTCDAYSSDYRLKIGHRFGVPVDTFSRVVEESAYPSRDAVLTYVDDVETQLRPWVCEMVQKALSGASKARSPLQRVVYLLRHTVVHLAYVRREMYTRGIKRPSYGKRVVYERT